MKEGNIPAKNNHLVIQTLSVIIARMIKRLAETEIGQLLREFPAVGVLGPRQVGKTTLATTIAQAYSPTPIYLDLESPTDLAKLSEPEAYFELHKGTLIILDEIQRAPELFGCTLECVPHEPFDVEQTGPRLLEHVEVGVIDQAADRHPRLAPASLQTGDAFLAEREPAEERSRGQ